MSAVEKDDFETAKTRFGKDQLKAFVERIERLEEEKKTIADDIRDVYASPKPTVSTLRLCAPSCGCASRTSTSATSNRRSWKPT